MPTALHETPYDWMTFQVISWGTNGLLDLADFAKLEFSLRTVNHFLGRFAHKTKTPDFAIFSYVDGATPYHPSVVLESGVTESQPELQEDCALWLVGTAGTVKVVLLLKVYPPGVNRQVKVTLAIYRNLRGVICDHSEFCIFPIPDQLIEDPFITINELFAGRIPVDLDPDARLPLDLGLLRERLRTKIVELGWMPA